MRHHVIGLVAGAVSADSALGACFRSDVHSRCVIKLVPGASAHSRLTCTPFAVS